MASIPKYIPKTPAKKGIALITVILISTLLSLMAGTFTFVAISDLKVSESQLNGIKAYYLAEGGINKAIWKLLNDAQWQESFITIPDWSASLNEEEFEVSIQNTDLGKADIVSTGILSNARRIVKAKVFQAIGQGALPDMTVLSDGNIYIWNSAISIDEGDFSANQNIEIEEFSDVDVEKNVSAGNDIWVGWSSTLNANAVVEGAANINMPMVDFDGFKAQATPYSEQEFANLLASQTNTFLSGIHYVDGNVVLEAGKHLTINGLLLAEGNISIGPAGSPSQKAKLTINWSPGNPSGLISKGSIWFSETSGNTDIKGVVYASAGFFVTKFLPLFVFRIEGALISPHINISTLDHSLDFEYNQLIVDSVLDVANSSPLIDIEHWEEKY